MKVTRKTNSAINIRFNSMNTPPSLLRCYRYFFSATLVVLLTACSAAQPNLSSLYNDANFLKHANEPVDPNYRQPPVVVIPGIVSSTLKNSDGEEVWFGPWRKTLFSQYRNLALEIDPDTLEPLPSEIVAADIPNKVLFFNFYGSLFEVLENYGGFKLTKPGTPYSKAERRYYKFAYDWRYDNVATVKKLDELIEQIRKDYKDPNLQVDFIAHSMGGLVARYYMRYGTVDVLNDNDFPVSQYGARKVRKLIQLGTPNLGSVASLYQFIEGYKKPFVNVPVDVLATLPSAYQLLPHPLNTWLINTKGRPLRRDLYDTNIWRRLEWGLFDPKVIAEIKSQYETEAEGQARVELLHRYFEKHIERARRFVWSLTVPVPDLSYSIIAFGGNCTPTPARVVVEDIDGISHFRLWPKHIKNKVEGIDYEHLMLEPGDGRVTKPSLLARHYLNPEVPRHKYSFFPLDYAFFLCHGHGALTGNINFQDNLLNVLLERERQELNKSEVEGMM